MENAVVLIFFPDVQLALWLDVLAYVNLKDLQAQPDIHLYMLRMNTFNDADQLINYLQTKATNFIVFRRQHCPPL